MTIHDSLGFLQVVSVLRYCLVQMLRRGGTARRIHELGSKREEKRII